jgi:hypothetical protein
MFPYGIRVQPAKADSYLYDRCRQMFGRMAEAREFWLEEGTPSGTWYHTTGQFWFLKEHDLFMFYMRFHTAKR